MTTDTTRIGETETLSFTFRNASAVLTDPTSIVLSIREPDGTETAKTQADMTSPSTGLWTYDFAVTKAGRHFAVADGDGDVEAVAEIEFYALRAGAGV